jgi:hypothetical protein
MAPQVQIRIKRQCGDRADDNVGAADDMQDSAAAGAGAQFGWSDRYVGHEG